jgi:hypothetical protein
MTRPGAPNASHMNGLMPRKAPVEQLDLATADEGGAVVLHCHYLPAACVHWNFQYKKSGTLRAITQCAPLSSRLRCAGERRSRRFRRCQATAPTPRPASSSTAASSCSAARAARVCPPPACYPHAGPPDRERWAAQLGRQEGTFIFVADAALVYRRQRLLRFAASRFDT